MTELLSIWGQPDKQGALTQLAAFHAKYGKVYPEAAHRLAEEQDKTLTFYDFPQTMQRSIRTTNAIESLWSFVHQRTDQIDILYFGDELPDHRLGDYRGHQAAQSPGGMNRAVAEEGAMHNRTGVTHLLYRIMGGLFCSAQ